MSSGRNSLIKILCVALVVAFLVPVLAPPGTTASPPGDIAVIANADGDNVRLRAAPDPTSDILASFPEGTPVQVLAGPITSTRDGSTWYQVSTNGFSGYMIAAYLHFGETVTVTPVPPPAATAAPVTEPTTTVVLAVTGNATITNTSGDQIRCRLSASTEGAILARFREGDRIDLLGNMQGDWYPVKCASQAGYVHRDYVTIPGAVAATPIPSIKPTITASATTTPLATATSDTTVNVAAESVQPAAASQATVSGTGGRGVRCRATAAPDGAIITTLSEGSSVQLDGAKQGDWQPVICTSKKGFIFAQYLTLNNSTVSATPIATATPTVQYGVITNTGGQWIRCRAKPATDAAIITLLAGETRVQLRGAASNSWQPVVCASQDGFVYSDYIKAATIPTTTPTSTPTPSPVPTGGSATFLPGDLLVVANTGGQGVRMRSAAATDASIIVVLPEGKQVKVRTGSSGVWVAVTYNSENGFIHGDFLAKATSTGGGAAPSPTPKPSTTPGNGSLVKGDHARVTENLRLRAGPGTDKEVIAILPANTVVLITGALQSYFYPVDWDGVTGFMHGDYLAWTSDPITPSSTPVTGNAGSGAATAAGQALVDYAMNYLGYPYIWATHGPDSFDCSGFTYWVVLKTLKIDIGAGTWTQSAVGKPVQYGDLLPGDLVFFQNTYTFGLSHVGMYIGNNQFIHSENEQTGVRISSLTSNYYSSRWYGARRVT